MELNRFSLGSTPCGMIGDRSARYVLIQPCSSGDFSSIESEFEKIRARVHGVPFLLCAFAVESWNRDLSPWDAPALFGREPFGNAADRTLRFVLGDLMPALSEEIPRTFLIGGYSLAAFFSLWAVYQTDRFAGAAAASPSVWFPGWDEYLLSHRAKAKLVYLSLGNREEKTRNPVFARVGDRIRLQHSHFQETGETESFLEWNDGNHFRDGDLRTAKGFAFLLLRLRELQNNVSM